MQKNQLLNRKMPCQVCFLHFSSLFPFCLQSNIFQLLLITFGLLTFASFETPSPVNAVFYLFGCVVVFLISQGKTFLIGVTQLLNDEHELQRVLARRHVLYHVFIPSMKNLMVFFPRYCYLSQELCFDSLLILVNKTAPLLIYGAKKSVLLTLCSPKPNCFFNICKKLFRMYSENKCINCIGLRDLK